MNDLEPVDDFERLGKWWIALSDGTRAGITILATALIIALTIWVVHIDVIRHNRLSPPIVPPRSQQLPQQPSPTTPPSSQASAQPQTPAAPSCFTAAQAWNEIGQSGCVEFKVGNTYVSSACNAYLNQYSDYSSGFSVWIPDGCGLGTTLTNEYSGQTIDVSGTISSYHGAPEIQVTSSSQIQLAQ